MKRKINDNVFKRKRKKNTPGVILVIGEGDGRRRGGERERERGFMRRAVAWRGGKKSKTGGHSDRSNPFHTFIYLFIYLSNYYYHLLNMSYHSVVTGYSNNTCLSLGQRIYPDSTSTIIPREPRWIRFLHSHTPITLKHFILSFILEKGRP